MESEGYQRPQIKVKKKEELWLYSLTDLTFILMAFFALMLSMSKPDKQQFDEVASKVVESQQTAAPVPNLSLVAEDLEKIIVKENLQNDAQVKIDANGLLLEFSEKLVFASGSAQLNSQFQVTADKILKVLAQAPERYKIAVEGHTDDVPINKKSGFNSNWDLSAARAISMLQELQRRGIDGQRMRVLALADTEPKVSIMGKEGQGLSAARRANRRVIIRLD